MKLVALPKSPYWGANIHVGFTPEGKRRYSPKSSKVRRDPSNIGPNGERLDKLEAEKVLTALQNIANQAMTSESAMVTRMEFEEMVESVLKSVGKRVAPSAPPWGEFATEVLKRHCKGLARSTDRAYWGKKSAFDAWLALPGRRSDLSADSSVASFSLPDVQEFYDHSIDSGRKESTTNGILEGVAMIFERAVAEGHITKNPCSGVKRQEAVQISKKPFTVEELAKIVSAVSVHRDKIEHADEWGLAIKFAIFTGARLSDAIKLQWSDFSDGFRLVRFLPKKKERLHRLGKVDSTVSMILPEFLAQEFQAARESSESNLVTPSLIGITAGKNGLGPRFREILDFSSIEYEIRPPKGNKGISQCSHGFHSFRHTLKTELRAGGVSAETSNYVTGHDDEKVARRYVHEKAETIYRECEPVFEAFAAAIYTSENDSKNSTGSTVALN